MRGRRDPGPGSGRGRAGADRGGTRPWPDRCGRGVRRRPSMELQNQVKELARGYVRKGGKDNRRQQLARMLAFAAHVEAAGASGLGQVVGSHVVDYWRALRASGSLADSNLYAHWLAIRELWGWAGKPGEPPKPRPATAGEQKGGSRPEEGGGA